MKPSLGSLASPEIKGGATYTASPRVEEGATGASTITSVDAAGVSDCSPVVSGGAEPAGGIVEEEAISKYGNKKIKKKEIEEAMFKLSFCFLSPFDKPKVL